MGIKFKGSEQYNAVYAKLVETAKNKSTTTYVQLALAARLPTSGKYMSETIGGILSEITLECLNKSQPLLTCLVVRSGDTLPGNGFFQMLISEFGNFGFKRLSSEEEKEDFFELESDRVYTYWK